MSRTACRYDNAPMESFFHTLKVELVHQRRWTTREQARQTCSRISKATIIGAGSTPLSDTGPRNRPNDKWPKPVSTKSGETSIYGCYT